MFDALKLGLHGLTGGLRRYRGCSRGGVMMTAAVSFPLVFAVFGLASDYAMMFKLRGELQAAADAAALAAAHEIPLSKSNPQQIVNSAKTFAQYQLTGEADAAPPPDSEQQYRMAAAASASGPDASLVVDAEVVEKASAVKVRITDRWTPFFAHFIDGGITPIEVEATARYVGHSNVCVLGLSINSTSIELRNSARLEGRNCAVYSNSTISSGLTVAQDATLDSKLNCVAGGFSAGRTSAVTPPPVTDCPHLDDPLASRPAPNLGGCDHTGMVIDSQTVDLNPGVYCKGLAISGTAKVTLNPGIYIIDGGALHVSDTASLAGENAGFFLTGKGSVIHFSPGTTISLGAPETGALAGLLFYEDRNVTGVRNHSIKSNNAHHLLGTIYLPKSKLTIDASKPIADQSAYTAIVVNELVLMSGPNLVLNTDYDLTDVPVPDGIAGASQIVLSN